MTEGRGSMKVLVATRRTQGARDGDFDRCVDGELVWIQEPCGRDRRREDRACGCGRSFAGLASHEPTTTARVVSMPGLTRAAYAEVLRTGLLDGGWGMLDAAAIADGMLAVASWWDEGAILERDLDLLHQRLPVRR